MAVLTTLLRRADIPTPPAGYWMRKEFGKPVEQPSLPPTPSGCVEPLIWNTERRGGNRHLEQIKTELKVAPVARPGVQTPDSENKTPQPPKPRPSKPTTMTRVATFVAAGPLLVQQRKDREAAERERQLAEQRRYEEERRRKRDANRWRRFKEMAQDWRELATVRDFLATLRSMNVDPSTEIEGQSVAEWIAWGDNWLQRADPTVNGVDIVFRQIAAITDWTYRD
ncbi:MAG: hypothetical protein E5W85_04520 [Mesorhizobium sp.]|uniref:hypothetical protein n=1 Tax=Mesorhizobium sp. TaxID=1871066 RepID=UPI000FE508BF|nr:hypothetical protein [Mesorhizobium sp.]RWB35281.1 MAG: hypothetical protein EOQ41_05640 [Mesorhizobium sp.]TIT16156.1 MAG: hypothetical protein E5W85_04520 [Mesorhizobium sp.]